MILPGNAHMRSSLPSPQPHYLIYFRDSPLKLTTLGNAKFLQITIYKMLHVA
jgi:hypothetical protein